MFEAETPVRELVHEMRLELFESKERLDSPLDIPLDCTRGLNHR